MGKVELVRASHLATSRVIHWRCDKCQKEIADDDGAVWIDHCVVNQRTADYKEWEESDPNKGSFYRDIAYLMKMPPAVKWNVHHYDCADIPDFTGYDLDVSSVRTEWDLIHTTAHLMGKAWVPEHTNWEDILNRAAGDFPNGAGPRKELS